MSGDFTPILLMFCVGPLLTAALFFALGRWSKGIRITRDPGTGAPVVNDRRYAARDAADVPRGGIRKLSGQPKQQGQSE